MCTLRLVILRKMRVKLINQFDVRLLKVLIRRPSNIFILRLKHSS